MRSEKPQITLTRILTPKINSWDDFYQALLSLPNDDNFSRAGKIFEWFAKYYFLNTGEYENVYHDSELGSERDGLRNNLLLPKRDKGIDLVLIPKSSTTKRFVAVQCKFRKDQNSKLGWGKDELSHLIAHRSVHQHFVFSNASGVDKDVEKQGRDLQAFLFGDLLELSPDDFRSIRNLAKGRKPKRHKKAKTRRDQEVAINRVIDSFGKHARGQLILPCGAGKTLTALWIKERLRSKKTLVLVPSLALLRQVKNEWVANHKVPFEYLCVCSERDIDTEMSDSAVGSIFELGHTGLGVTTDPKLIRSAFDNTPDLVVFCTYQSSVELAKAMKQKTSQFDLAICDEAHRTASRKTKDSAWVTIHDQRRIPCKKRLYMTATPKIADPALHELAIKKQGRSLDFYLAEMGDQTTFGPEFYRQSFADAIKNKILVDYQIISIGLSNKELKEELRSYTTRSDVTYEDIAHNFVVKKIMHKYAVKHLITYHSTIKSAKRFAEDHRSIDPQCDTAYVTGLDSTAQRSHILNNLLVKAERGVVSNARCLTEGIDIPTIDGVYFSDPKHSTIDIVQAAGRALRISRSKSYKKNIGYIFVPTFHDSEDSVEEQIQEGAWDNLIRVVRALSDHDSRVQQYVSNLIWGKAPRSKSRKQSVGISEFAQIIIDGFDKQFQKNLFFQGLRKTLDVPWRPFEDARTFVRNLNLKGEYEWRAYCRDKLMIRKPGDIPADPKRAYQNLGWVGYGDWLGTGRISTRQREYRTFHDARSWIHKLNLQSQKDWKRYIAGEFKDKPQKPHDIPSNPNTVYKNDGWLGLGDWLGTGTIAPHLREYRTFQDARMWIRQLNLKTQKEWQSYTNKGIQSKPPLPEDIPANPHVVYKKLGWLNLGDWLGTKRIASRDIIYRDFRAARKWARSLGLLSETEWRKFKKGKTNGRLNLPKNIPSKPERTYRNKGWVGFGDWLGTGNVAPRLREYLEFEKARYWVRNLDLKTYQQWKLYVNGHLKSKPQKPSNIPSNPNLVYKNDGWLGFGDWLGTGNIAPRKRSFRDFIPARQFARSLGLGSEIEWRIYRKGQIKGKPSFPRDIPTNPNRTYKNNGWISWQDWLRVGAPSSSKQ